MAIFTLCLLWNKGNLTWTTLSVNLNKTGLTFTLALLAFCFRVTTTIATVSMSITIYKHRYIINTRGTTERMTWWLDDLMTWWLNRPTDRPTDRLNRMLNWTLLSCHICVRNENSICYQRAFSGVRTCFGSWLNLQIWFYIIFSDFGLNLLNTKWNITHDLRFCIWDFAYV